MNVFTNLARAAGSLPEHPAIVFEGAVTSYGALHRRCLALAQRLGEAGIRPGDVVALVLPNRPEQIALTWACYALGALPCPVSALLRGEELSAVLTDARPRAIVVDGATSPQLGDLSALTSLTARLCLDGDLPPGFAPLPAVDGPPLRRPAARHPHDPAAVLYTSGTTGAPRGAVLSQANLITNAAAVAHAQGLRPGDRLLCALPLFHCFGQNHIVGGAFRAGATVVLHRRFDVDAVLAGVAEAGVTRFYGAPTAFRRLLGRAELPRAFASVRSSLSAAAAMDPGLAGAWGDAVPARLEEAWGLTESSPFAAYNHPFGYLPGTVGVAIDGVEIAIEGEGGERLAEGEVGEVVLRGPNVMLGYLGHPEESAQALRGGWLHTGDVGRLDDRGALTLVDRLKDLINCAGFKVWPREVEERLARAPGVAQAAVVGLPDADRGERVAAVVVPASGARVDEEAIRAYARVHLAPYKVPREVHVAPTLPLSPSGKVLRRALRAQLLGGSPAPKVKR